MEGIQEMQDVPVDTADQAAEAQAAEAAFSAGKVGEQKAGKQIIEVQTPAEPARFAGKTEDEITALLGEIPTLKSGYRKQIDDLAGNYGKLNAILQRIQSEKTSINPVEVTDEDMKGMIDEGWPEEMVAAQKNILNNVLKKIHGGKVAAVNDEQIADFVSKRVSGEMIPINKNLLDTLRPDWAEITKPDDTTDYRKWLSTQPEDYRKKILESNNAFEVIGSIKSFENHREEAANRHKEKEQRLKNAIQPEGKVTTKGTLTEQQAADVAFSAGRRR